MNEASWFSVMTYRETTSGIAILIEEGWTTGKYTAWNKVSYTTKRMGRERRKPAQVSGDQQ